MPSPAFGGAELAALVAAAGGAASCFGAGAAFFFRRPIKNRTAAITTPHAPAAAFPCVNSGTEETRNSAPTIQRINVAFFIV